MADSKKVIDHFSDCCDIAAANGNGWVLVRTDVLHEALALLKAQDETRLVRHYLRPGVYADLWLHCEKCGERLDDGWHPKYCPGCGREVKWNE